MFTTEFLITSRILKMLPGTGVIYALATGLAVGRQANVAFQEGGWR